MLTAAHVKLARLLFPALLLLPDVQRELACVEKLRMLIISHCKSHNFVISYQTPSSFLISVSGLLIRSSLITLLGQRVIRSPLPSDARYSLLPFSARRSRVLTLQDYKIEIKWSTGGFRTDWVHLP